MAGDKKGVKAIDFGVCFLGKLRETPGNISAARFGDCYEEAVTELRIKESEDEQHSDIGYHGVFWVLNFLIGKIHGNKVLDCLDKDYTQDPYNSVALDRLVKLFIKWHA